MFELYQPANQHTIFLQMTDSRVTHDRPNRSKVKVRSNSGPRGFSDREVERKRLCYENFDCQLAGGAGLFDRVSR
jgi:hypothetical protein